MTEILFLLLHIFLLHCEILRNSRGENSIDGYFLLCGYYFNVLCHGSGVPEILFSHFIATAMSTNTETFNSKKMDVKTLSKAQMRFNFSFSGLSCARKGQTQDNSPI